MKKWIALVLACVLLCACFCGCADTEQPETMPQKTPEGVGVEIGQQLGVSYLTAEQVRSLPVATADMTKEELRQLCLDYYEIQKNFMWHPNMDLEFYMTYKDGIKTVSKEDLHSGLLYQSQGTGNLYRALEYYDEETGTFDLQTALAENGGYGEGAQLATVETNAAGEVTYYRYRSMMTMFNQCSVSVWWGISRVINSANYAWTYDMTVANGFIPVGCYTYGYEYGGKWYGPAEIKAFGEKDAAYNNPLGYDTKHVIQDWNVQGGETAMFDCYIQAKPADVLVNNSHTMMVKSVNLQNKPDGTVDYENTTVTVVEQVEGWSKEEVISGITYRQQGREKTYKLTTLQKQRYIPFTFIEFLDENDPQDKKHIDYYNEYFSEKSAVAGQYDVFQLTDEELKEMTGPGVEKAVVFTTLPEDAKSINVREFAGMTVGANYSISDVFVRVRDAKGNEVLKNIYRAKSPRVREVPMTEMNSTWQGFMYDGVQDFADGKHTLEITVQLSTGELLTAFSGTLNP